uniref:KIB1-4 beta-propeller domain-containing protein n=1 Tax=Oryza punctata TaxID=4537 RepID=A0A0E0JYA4_ORYPU
MEINEKAQDSTSLVDESRLAPLLLFGHGEAGDKFLYSIPSRRQLTAAPAFVDLIGHYSWITPRGWVLTLQPAGRRGDGDGDVPAEAFLRDPFSSRRVRLPPPDQEISALAAKALGGGDDDAVWCVLSHDPTDPCCVVVVVHPTEPVLFYCRPGGAGRRWLRHEYQPEAIIAPANHDDDDDDNYNLDAVVIRYMRCLTASGGKLYTDLQWSDKMVTLEFSPSPTLVSAPLAMVPCPAWCNNWNSSLVDSHGELFVVHFRYSLLCYRTILLVQVHRLDSTRRAWVKADGLGSNRVFLVTSQFGVSMAADEAGLEENCIYFTKSDDKGLYVYDVGQGTTALYDPGEDIPDSMEPILLLPVS